MSPTEVWNAISNTSTDIDIDKGMVQLATTVGGCRTPTVSPAPTPMPTTLAQFSQSCEDQGMDFITVKILTDNWPEETSWNVHCAQTSKTQCSKNDYTPAQAQSEVTTNDCVDAGVHVFTLLDAYGDGKFVVVLCRIIPF